MGQGRWMSEDVEHDLRLIFNSWFLNSLQRQVVTKLNFSFGTSNQLFDN